MPGLLSWRLDGSEERTERILLYIVNYGEGHINGIAKTFDVFPSQVDRQIKRLEAAGILVSRELGSMRMFMINPRLSIKNELGF